MRRFRVSRGPSSSEIIRQGQIRKLLLRYGAYSRQLVANSSSSSSSTVAISKSTTAQQLQSSSMQLASSSRRALHQTRQEAVADANVKVAMKPSQLIPVGYAGQMDRGLALAAAQHVARVLAEGESNTVEAQQVKEELLHQLERDYGFGSPDQLGLGKIRITIKRRDNDLEIMRRQAEHEKAELERKRLEERLAAQSRKVQSTAIASSQEFSSSKVVKTRVVKKVVKRTVQTVRVA